MKKCLIHALCIVLIAAFTFTAVQRAMPVTARAAAKAMPSGSYSVMVGQTLTLSWSTSKVLNSATWTTNASNNIQIVSSSYFNCTIKGLAASGSTFVVQCDYYYWVTSGMFSYLAQDTEVFYIKVYAPDPTGVSIPANCTLQVGQNTTLTPSLTPSNATATFTWSSSNASVASVSGGTISAHDVGSAVVTVSTQNGLRASCNVTVTEPPMAPTGSVPANNSINASTGTTVSVSFPSALSQGGAFAGIKLARVSDGATVQGTAAISDRSVVFTPAQNLAYGAAYRLTIPAGALVSKWGTLNSSAFSINFTTVALDVAGTVPANGAFGVAADSTVSVTFNMNISSGSAYGSISLVKVSDGSAVAATTAISGAKLTVTPGAALAYNTKYRLTVPSGALVNADGVVYQKTFTLEFTTDLEPGTFAGGNGTAAAPYVVTSQAQLDRIRLNLSAYYELGCDIALSGNWVPLGTFSGSLDGRGHSVTNLTVPSSVGSEFGLFGSCSNAHISNLTVKTSATGVSASTNTSRDVYAGILAGHGSMTVENCRVEGQITCANTARTTYIAYVGGLIGNITSGSVTDCGSSAGVTYTANSTFYIGGLIGRSGAPISGSSYSGYLKLDTAPTSTDFSAYIGGLAGYSTNTIYNSRTAGGDGTGIDLNYSNCFGYVYFYAGGLAGYSTGMICNCFSDTPFLKLTGAAPSTDYYSKEIHYFYVGGLAGWSTGSVSYSGSGRTALNVNSTSYARTELQAGGFIGNTEPGSVVSHCYSNCGVTAGAITSGVPAPAYTYAGGFIALCQGSVDNCYATGDVVARSHACASGEHNYVTVGGFFASPGTACTNCYSTGCPAGNAGGGELTAGYGFTAFTGATFTGCYYDSTTSKCSDTRGGVPKTTEEMSQASTYAGWDFDTVWNMDADKSPYPTFFEDSKAVNATKVDVVSDHGALSVTEDKGMLQLTAKITPAYATNKAVSWSVDNSALASVDKDGMLSAKLNGTVTVRATAKDGSAVYGEIMITISNQIKRVEKITVSGAGNAEAITMDKGTLGMSAAVLPADATDKAVDWSVDNGEVASIDASGLLTAKTDGTVTVRATAKDGSGVYGEITITVSNQTLRTQDGFIARLQGGEAVIVGYDGPGGDITVPREIGGKAVTAIGESAFSGCLSITSAVLQTGLKEVRSNAFSGCRNLASVTIPEGVTALYQDSFSGTALVTVGIPASVTTLESIFGTAYSGSTAYDCEKLVSIDVAKGNPDYASVDGVLFSKDQKVLIRYPSGRTDAEYTIPDGVETIGPQAFENCALTKVNMPGTLKEISQGAFSGCAELAGLTLPESLETIGEMAFESCTALQSVTVPGGVTKIESGAFAFCTGLKEISAADGNAQYESLDGVLFSKRGDVLVQYPCGKGDATYTVPHEVVEIGPSAFAGTLKNLSEVVMAEGLTQIGAFAFEGCSALTKADLPNSVTEIGQYAWLSCQELKSVLLGSGLAKIGDSAFALCGKLGAAYFTCGMPTFGDKVFDKAAANFCVFFHVGQSAGWGGFTLYNKQAYCNAELNLQDGSEAKTVILFLTNGRATAPASPARAGYIFAGWYKDAQYTAAWDFSTATITGDIALFAKWAAFVPPAPTSVSTASATYCSIRISWGAASGADGYEVYRAVSSAGTYSLAGSATAMTYTDAGLVTGTTYYYKVRAYAQTGSTKSYGPWSAVVSAKPLLPAPASPAAAQASYNCINVTWKAVDGASGYEVWRATSALGSYTQIASTTSVRCTNTGVNTGTAYYYKVRAYRIVASARVYGAYSAVVSAKTALSAPASAKAVPATYNSIRVTWGAVAGTTKYEVYRSTSPSGAYKLLASTTTAAYVDAGVNTGTTYYYKVRAYRLVGSVKVYSGYSAVVYARATLAAPSPVRAARASSTSIKVYWAAVPGATKYEVWYSTSSGGTYSLLTTTGSTSFTKTGLKTGTTYYFKVRAYRLVGSTKVYGGFSAVACAKP